MAAKEEEHSKNLWFWDEITREEAEKILFQQEDEDGYFLVRNNSRCRERKSLSVLSSACGEGNDRKSRIAHFEVHIAEDHSFYSLKFLEGAARFPTLNALIEHYKKNSIFTKENRGGIPRLWTEGILLTKPCIHPRDIGNHSWYWPNIKRREAEVELRRHGRENGTFLLRNREMAEGNAGEWTLSMLVGRNAGPNLIEEVAHVRVKTTEWGKVHFKEETFDTIPEMIAYYRTNFYRVRDHKHLLLTHGCTLPSPATNAWIREVTETLIRTTKISREKKLRDPARLDYGKMLPGYYGDIGFVIKKNPELWKKNKRLFIKKLEPESILKIEFISEAAIMTELNPPRSEPRHNRIVQLYAVLLQTQPHYMFIEAMVGGNLLQFLRGEGQLLPESKLLNFASQITDAMSYMEMKRIVHRGLSAKNILVEGDLSGVKVGNFGLARQLDPNGEYDARSIDIERPPENHPVKWLEPEANKTGIFTMKTDVWSFGVLFLEIITHGRTPYPGVQSKSDLDKLMASICNGYRHPKPDECSQYLYKYYMLNCWEEDAERRPSFHHLHRSLCSDLLSISAGESLVLE